METEDIKLLLDSIIEASYELDGFYRETPHRPKPGNPASATELKRLDAHLAKLGFRAPQSYRQALSIYNGIEDMLGTRYSLLSIDAVINKDYKLIPEMVQDYPSSSSFVICAGNTPDFVGFDVDTAADDGDYEVVWVMGDGSMSRDDNFESFLNGYLGALKKNIADEKKDRVKLKNVTPKRKGLKK